MNRSNDDRTTPKGTTDDDRIRSLLEEAADPAPPVKAPPFLAARVRALASENHSRASQAPLAHAATRLLPVFVAVALLLVGAAGYESAVAATEREAAVARALARDGGSDVLLGAVLLASPTDDRKGGPQ